MKPFSTEARRNKILEIDFLNQKDGTTDSNYKNDYLKINSIELDLNEDIFRIFKYEYFLDDLRDRKLTLVRPHEWKDKFENFLLNSQGKLEDGTIVSFENIRDCYYAQCWTLKEECDGLWKNYKGDNDFVIKVKASSKKLFDAFYDITNKFHYLSYFIGKVEYVSDKEIANYFKEKIDFTNFQSGIELAYTLLLKRKPFSYEEEVRLILHDMQINTTNLLRVDIDLNEVIEEIVFDPWIKPDLFKIKTQELINNGFHGKITKSGLYNEPFFIAKL